MELIEKLLYSMHIIAGFSVIFAGILAFIFRKGGKGHALAGNIFAYGMYTVAFSAFAICLILRFNLFLFILGIFSFYLTYTGKSVLKRKIPGQESNFDRGLAWFTTLSGITMVGYGAWIFISSGAFNPFIILSTVFGCLTTANGWEDIRLFSGKKDRSHRNWWLTYHVARMGGAFIAASTAFLVFGARSFIGDHPLAWIVWLIPTIVISPILSIINRKIRAKRKKRVTESVQKSWAPA